MFFVLVIAFLTVRFSGEPFEAMFPQGITVEHEEALKKKWLLDRPLMEQFTIYLGNMLRGDFRRSLRFPCSRPLRGL
jgi:ABC-type dipeptide/oligopeptide/nickel transport system permease component